MQRFSAKSLLFNLCVCWLEETVWLCALFGKLIRDILLSWHIDYTQLFACLFLSDFPHTLSFSLHATHSLSHTHLQRHREVVYTLLTVPYFMVERRILNNLCWLSLHLSSWSKKGHYIRVQIRTSLPVNNNRLSLTSSSQNTTILHSCDGLMPMLQFP